VRNSVTAITATNGDPQYALANDAENISVMNVNDIGSLLLAVARVARVVIQSGTARLLKQFCAMNARFE
jgi:hypothetical protein